MPVCRTLQAHGSHQQQAEQQERHLQGACFVSLCGGRSPEESVRRREQVSTRTRTHTHARTRTHTHAQPQTQPKHTDQRKRGQGTYWPAEVTRVAAEVRLSLNDQHDKEHVLVVLRPPPVGPATVPPAVVVVLVL
jgi:hypothetical protein